MQLSSFAKIRQRLGAALLSLLVISSARADTDEIVYFHTDANGSPTAAFNEAGEVCWTETYSPYGEKLDNEDSLPPTEGCGLIDTADVAYTGHVQDASGLVYAQQRYYDPVIGRFMSTDPVMPNAGDPRHFGRYHYAFNNPYRYTDPQGMEPGPEDGEEYDDFVEAEYGSGVGYGWEGSHNGLDTNGATEEFIGLQDVIGESQERSFAKQLMDYPFLRGFKFLGPLKNRLGLTPDQIRNLKRFFGKAPANAKDSITVRGLPNNGVAVQATSKGKVPGSRAVYEKQIDANGKTVQSTKTTYDPQGDIVHVKDKLNGGTYIP